ncbi:prothoracicostatic peptides [Atheta coriaria]|uniref:prothoracicostatic peptides n=1 Tax=Dalotia coriaria TaxID=877792 RepID=UPI0031F33F5B
MRYAVTSSTKTLIGVVVIFCCLRAGLALASEDATKQESEANDQLEMSKRGWAKGNPSMMHSWGKRAWQNLQGGWGKRDLWGPSNSYPLYMSSDKRAWQNLQGGWGKRFATDEEYAAKLAALLSDEELQQRLADYNDAVSYNGLSDGEMADYGSNDDEKRAWRSLNNAGWGKRAAQWGSFRGSWGKRDPAWTNLKGIWGKRSVADKAQ